MYSWPPCTNSYHTDTILYEHYCDFLQKPAALMRRSTVLSRPVQLAFLGRRHGEGHCKRPLNQRLASHLTSSLWEEKVKVNTLIWSKKNWSVNIIQLESPKSKKWKAVTIWCHDIQHNDIQHNNTQPNGLNCDTKYKWLQQEKHIHFLCQYKKRVLVQNKSNLLLKIISLLSTLNWAGPLIIFCKYLPIN
jgi:hypothetical protein